MPNNPLTFTQAVAGGNFDGLPGFDATAPSSVDTWRLLNGGSAFHQNYSAGSAAREEMSDLDMGLGTFTSDRLIDALNALSQSNASSANQVTKDLMQLQYDYNSKLVDQANHYNTWSSSTQYQRAVEDLKRAGLNPLLAYTNGGNSAMSSATAAVSSGSGQMASVFGESGVGLSEGLMKDMIEILKDLYVADLNNSTSARNATLGSLTSIINNLTGLAGKAVGAAAGSAG